MTNQVAPPIAFALDFSTTDEARAAAREVAPSIGMVKVGLELFVGAGPSIVGGMLYVNSGYSHHGAVLPGNVLLAFAVEQ